MSKKILDLVRFAIRASGLLGVICFSAFLVITPIISTKPSALLSVCGAWVLAAAVLSWPRIPEAWRKDPPTDRQLEYAASLGIPVPDGISKGQLSDMIKQITGR
jgi:hypothetical protein